MRNRIPGIIKIDDMTVSTICLGPVKCHVGKSQKIFGCLWLMMLYGGYAYAQCYGCLVGAIIIDFVLKHLPYLFRGQFSAYDICVREKDHEFLSAIPKAHIRFTYDFFKGHRKFFQNIIPEDMTIRVINQFKKIQIDQEA